MNPRELLARLNVPAVRYEIGRGGIPDLTNIDIAGALGMVKDEFSRDIFIALWWEDGAKSGRIDLEERIRNLILLEFGQRSKALAIARLEQNIAQCAIAGKRCRTAFDDKITRACTMAVEEAKGRVWSYKTDVYVRVPGAVIQEILNPRLCDECKGRGEITADGLRRKCPGCNGYCTKPEKKINRAGRLKVSYESYRDKWSRIYSWTYDLVSRAERGAELEFARAISRDEQPA